MGFCLITFHFGRTSLESGGPSPGFSHVDWKTPMKVRSHSVPSATYRGPTSYVQWIFMYVLKCQLKINMIIVITGNQKLDPDIEIMMIMRIIFQFFGLNM